ncbi:MAG: tRNA (guanosine(46)-N7)-methyltransferase TrmB, partial [Candidatus Saccharimonas sp.]
MDPEQFVISRRRKKYRFAKFFNAENCFELEEWVKRPVDTPKIDVLEIGAGTGFFSVELASRHPDQTFVALDVKADRLQRGAYEALEKGVNNVFFVRARADQIDQLAPPKSVSSIWVTFPDPFPRERSERRRLMHPYFLAQYRELLADSGSLYLKHDNREFFDWSLEQLKETGWVINEFSFNLHASNLDYNYKVLTSYEIRWLNEGLETKFVKATKPTN